MWDGLVDLQVNGFAGVDFNDARIDAAAMAHALRAMRATGVATCLPTVITATEEDLATRLAALDAAVAGCGQTGRGLQGMVPGWHLEGPFLNPAPAYAGCHPPAAMRAPDVGLVERLERELRRPILLLTLAPELPGAEELIRWASSRGKIVALGHTGADADAVARAVAAGARMSTHLGNAMSGPMHKFLNPMMAQLAEDGLAAGFIADGVHIPPAALQVMMRAKGPARSILVTDATSAAGTAPGLYDFAGMRIEHAADGSVRVPGEVGLAGSALRMDVAVRNVIGWGVASETEAVAMARENPMRLLAPAMAAHAG